MANLEAAFSYLARGWSVFPAHHITTEGFCSCPLGPTCPKPAKHPRGLWGAYETRLPTMQELRRWWGSHPTDNIAIICGKLSGLFVLDGDPRNGWEESLRDLRTIVTVPPTLTVATGGADGGRHFYYAYPPDVTLRNEQRQLPGMNTRGEGGYVIAPPSLHASGKRYEWLELEDGEALPSVPAPMPPDLLAWFLEPHAPRPLDDPDEQPTTLDLMAAVTTAPLHEGERNIMLTRFAGSLFGRGVPPDVTEFCLYMLAQHAEAGAAPIGLKEVQTIAHSVNRMEQRKRDAAAKLDEMVTPENIGLVSAETKEEMLRAFCRERLGLSNVQAGFCVIAADGVQYELELADATVTIPGKLTTSQAGLRDTLLNHGARMPGYKPAAWINLMWQFRQLVTEVQVGAIRAVDRVEEWTIDYVLDKQPQEFLPDARADALDYGPIIVEGQLVTRLRPFLAFLKAHYGYDKYTPEDLGRLLRAAGWTVRTTRAGHKQQVRTWVAPRGAYLNTEPDAIPAAFLQD